MTAAWSRKPEGSIDVSMLLDEILTDAHGDDEQLWALRQAFEDNVLVNAGRIATTIALRRSEIARLPERRRGRDRRVD